MRLENCRFLIDIDGTITRYTPERSAPGATLHGNLFFPVIRDLMLVRGWEKEAAEKALYDATNNVLRWDYGELLRQFGIPFEEALSPMLRRHEDFLEVHEDAVSLIRSLQKLGAHIFIISNNPFWGCRWKLRRAGLEPELFEFIFSTDLMGGCKSLIPPWEFVFSRIGVEPEQVVVIGDDPKEDGEIPQSLGAGRSFILWRNQNSLPRNTDRSVFVKDAREIVQFLTRNGEIYDFGKASIRPHRRHERIRVRN